MSEQEQNQKKGETITAFIAARARLALLKQEAGKIANSLESFAKVLRENPGALKPEDGDVLYHYQNVGKLITDMLTTSGELAELKSTMLALGLRELI